VDSKLFRAFFNFDDLKTEVVEGNVKRVVYTGRNIQVVEYHFPPHKRFTAHKHDEHEQMGYLIRGRMGFVVDGQERVLEPGDYYHAQIGQMHNAWTFEEPSVLLDVFGPTRDDLLAVSNAWRDASADDAAE
jgi:quercetin dioxygenase-like cupin family protein